MAKIMQIYSCPSLPQETNAYHVSATTTSTPGTSTAVTTSPAAASTASTTHLVTHVSAAPLATMATPSRSRTARVSQLFSLFSDAKTFFSLLLRIFPLFLILSCCREVTVDIVDKMETTVLYSILNSMYAEGACFMIYSEYKFLFVIQYLYSLF